MTIRRNKCELCGRRFFFGFTFLNHSRNHARLAQIEGLMAENRARRDDLDRYLHGPCQACEEMKAWYAASRAS